MKHTSYTGFGQLLTFFLDGWYISTPPLKQTMMAIDGLSCRFFICLYDLNTFCFFSSWFRDVVGTHFLDVYARPLAAEKILINFKTKSLEIKRYWEYARRCKSDGNQIPHHDDVIMKVEEAKIYSQTQTEKLSQVAFAGWKKCAICNMWNAFAPSHFIWRLKSRGMLNDWLEKWQSKQDLWKLLGIQHKKHVGDLHTHECTYLIASIKW